MKRFFKNNYASYILDAGILEVIYTEGLRINLKEAQLIVSDRLYFQDHLSCPILCDVQGVTAIDFDARNYLAGYGSALTTAVALLATDKPHHVLADYFISIASPKIPTKFFNNRAQALLFLETFK